MVTLSEPWKIDYQELIVQIEDGFREGMKDKTEDEIKDLLKMAMYLENYEFSYMLCHELVRRDNEKIN